MTSLLAPSTAHITDDSVVRRVADCTARHQTDQVLIYNPQTDELHLIPTDAFRIVELCENGIRAGVLIDRVAVAASVGRSDAAAVVTNFIQDLNARGILEITANG